MKFLGHELDKSEASTDDCSEYTNKDRSIAVYVRKSFASASCTFILNKACATLRVQGVNVESIEQEMRNLIVSMHGSTALAEPLPNAVDQKDQWYSVDYHGGVELHDSPQEAKDSAQYTIDHALDDHWPEGMTRIQWGRLNVAQTCIEKDRREKPKPDDPEAEEWPDNSLDYMCEYVLQDEEL